MRWNSLVDDHERSGASANPGWRTFSPDRGDEPSIFQQPANADAGAEMQSIELDKEEI
jgi:hypothetical protein